MRQNTNHLKGVLQRGEVEVAECEPPAVLGLLPKLLELRILLDWYYARRRSGGRAHVRRWRTPVAANVLCSAGGEVVAVGINGQLEVIG